MTEVRRTQLDISGSKVTFHQSLIENNHVLWRKIDPVPESIPGGGGGYFRKFGGGMSLWDPGTLRLHQSSFK